MKILIIDDNQAMLMAVQRLLEKAGYLVETATGLTDGYNLALEYRPDVIISDYEVPDGNGLELFNKLYLSSKLPFTRYILMSGKIGSELENLVKKNKPYNVLGFLRKPFPFVQLQQLLNASQSTISTFPAVQRPVLSGDHI
jgi:DNA-binding NtrC family response regulator